MLGAIYKFEEIAPDLPIPPLAALRALRLTGLLVSRSGWQQMPPEARQALTNAGAADHVSTDWVRQILAAAPLRELKMLPAAEDPNPHDVPRILANALGPGQPIPRAMWTALRPVDRHVLVTIAQNTRLLHRMLEELAQRRTVPSVDLPTSWKGLVAHCEVQMTLKTAIALQSTTLHGGHALVLARVAGVRAARLADDLIDTHAHVGVRTVELAANDRITGSSVAVVWQGHVSTIDGAFSPSASILAVSTAAAVLYDMAASLERTNLLSITNGRIIDEPWFATSREDATIVHDPRALGE